MTFATLLKILKIHSKRYVQLFRLIVVSHLDVTMKVAPDAVQEICPITPSLGWNWVVPNYHGCLTKV
jgi:hypothetical protein